MWRECAPHPPPSAIAPSRKGIELHLPQAHSFAPSACRTRKPDQIASRVVAMPRPCDSWTARPEGVREGRLSKRCQPEQLAGEADKQSLRSERHTPEEFFEIGERAAHTPDPDLPGAACHGSGLEKGPPEGACVKNLLHG